MQFPDVLVLGATGRIGRILQAGWSGGTPPESILWHGRTPARSDEKNWVHGDLLTQDEALLARLPNCRTILCLSGVIPGREPPGSTLSDNTGLALSALRIGARTGARVLLASSASVYGNQPGPLPETATASPVSAYGRAKLDMESDARKLADTQGVQCCLLRIGNIAGIDSVLAGWHPGFALDRFPDGRTPRRSYIGPRDLARVLYELIRQPDLPEVLNIAATTPIELGALLDAAGHVWHPRIPSADAIPEVWLDTTRLDRLLSCPPARNPADIVRQWREMTPDVNGARITT
ncbi:NAD(P)-dependent oxidoreductase [Ruegeria pomeroyi]|uniref:NAD-dependent epimerase/dehydratase family protein n=1 Tax=Ruegeria pomeroyi TaxID=89184 RepID=UPI001F478518|nr:NAD(P)-dependent oxidoreductase [Ruegeria pomeroyi]MCE8509984.1 NAD(P)-dependent oxidoreductase [Ruegeria pomeroyi]MCE8556928.1 NAD(P)-dependent oxidoreductase [Ruegeria pomeroyi]